MEKDMFGVSRLKVNLHMHTTLSDGSKTPEEAAEIYKKAGYDVVAITDHWIHRDSGEIGGLRILSGAEYNIGGGDASTGIYHILGIGCSKKPNLTQEAGPQKIIDEVHRCSGIAILAHPAWSLNTAQQAAALNGVKFSTLYLMRVSPHVHIPVILLIQQHARAYFIRWLQMMIRICITAMRQRHGLCLKPRLQIQMRRYYRQLKKKSFTQRRDQRFILEEMAMR